MEEIKEKIIKYKAKDGRLFKAEKDCFDYERHLTNLGMETLEIIKEYNKSTSDVEYVLFGKNLYTTFEQFLEKAKDKWYNCNFGDTEIRDTIFVVAKDWWLERHEYDGSEWWEFKEKPTLENRVKQDITKKDI